ncbi:hypothetical protein [Kosmotoga sp. DU53]|nr:hypothetical protein [Kosmotoga sp. DU53]
MPADEKKALAIGCVGYIKKPFFPENFIPEIEKYLFENKESDKHENSGC